jgi:predicted dehydrogenase
MVRLGIIGCGGMGGYHAKRFTEMQQVELVGVCDVLQEKATALAEQLGVKAFTHHQDLLPAVDAVCICTPPRHRLDVMLDSARAGKHVFAEKPLALNLAEADLMVEAARQAGIKLMVGYVLRFTQPHKYLHEVFSSGELGRLVNCWTRRYMPCDMSNRWYGDQAQSGGVLLDFGSHDIDLLCWKGGEVRSVYAQFDRVRPTIRSDEHAQVLMTFQQGGMGTVDVSWSSHLSHFSFGVVGSEGTLISDAAGLVHKKLWNGEEQVIDTAALAKAQPPETIQEHFVRYIEQDSEPLVTGAQARSVLAVILAAQESGRTDQVVPVR